MQLTTHPSNIAYNILWIYIVLLFAGGLVGFFKAGSKMSLIMSASFAVILMLCQFDLIFKANVADMVLLFLLVFFTVRSCQIQKVHAQRPHDGAHLCRPDSPAHPLLIPFQNRTRFEP